MKKSIFKRSFKLLLAITICTNAIAQHRVADSLLAFQEMAKVRQTFMHLPLQLDIHIQNKAEPVTNSNDTIHSDIKFFWSKPEIYVQADGLEEIANDSLIVLVNNDVKQILLYPGNSQMLQKTGNGFSGMLPDSSLKWLSKTYSAYTEVLDGNRKKIVITSRENIFGTQLPKESASLTYRSGSYEAIEFSQTKLSLLPVDSSVYKVLSDNQEYQGKLISMSTKQGYLFFLVKKLTTNYTFKNIDYTVQGPPVKQEARVLRGEDGNYMPAKGFEEYILSKEF